MARSFGTRGGVRPGRCFAFGGRSGLIRGCVGIALLRVVALRFNFFLFVWWLDGWRGRPAQDRSRAVHRAVLGGPDLSQTSVRVVQRIDQAGALDIRFQRRVVAVAHARVDTRVQPGVGLLYGGRLISQG